MNKERHQQLVALIERHLAFESQLADALDQMNQVSADTLAGAGLRGPTEQDLELLRPISERLQKHAAKISDARKALLKRVNAESDSEYTTIKEIIVCLEPVERRRLNSQRRGILEKSATAQANLVHNQAVLFYTYDFHRKYLAGVLQTDVDSHSYDSGGQSQDVPPGNIYGKTC